MLSKIAGYNTYPCWTPWDIWNALLFINHETWILWSNSITHHQKSVRLTWARRGCSSAWPSSCTGSRSSSSRCSWCCGSSRSLLVWVMRRTFWWTHVSWTHCCSDWLRSSEQPCLPSQPWGTADDMNSVNHYIRTHNIRFIWKADCRIAMYLINSSFSYYNELWMNYDPLRF